MRVRIHKNESGMASMVIAILIVIVVTTIVLGFMQIIRREQRRSLDNQLSSQAYYAAESGVNDAIKAVRQQSFTTDKTTCAPLSSGPAAITGNGSNFLTADGNIQYSCLLVDQSPTSLVYDKVSTTHGNVFPLVNSAGAIDSVTFTWQNPDGISSSTRQPAPTTFDFPPAATWNSLGLLRVDIIPVPSVARASLIANQRTYFMYPSRGGSATVIGYGGSSGDILDGNCSNGAVVNTSHVCSVTINGLAAMSAAGPIYVRVLAMYNPVKLTITGKDGAGAVAGLSGAQTLVDATGKAADVQRRIQVRVPFQDADLPDYAIASMDSFCKKFTASADGTATSEVPADPTCDPNQ